MFLKPHWKLKGNSLFLEREPTIEVDLASVQRREDFDSTMGRIGSKRLQPDEVAELATILFNHFANAHEAERKKDEERIIELYGKLHAVGEATREAAATQEWETFGYGKTWGRWVYGEYDGGPAGIRLDGHSYPVLLEQLTSREELARMTGHMAAKDEYGAEEAKDIARALAACFHGAELPPDLERTPEGIRRRK